MIVAAFGMVLGCVATSFARDEKAVVHPIDAAQAKCLKTHHGTMPRAKCYSDASEAWNKDVTKTFAALLSIMKSEDKDAMKSSQSTWESFRDAEFDVISHFYGRKKGTGYISVRIIARMEVVKARAFQLENWLETLKNQ